ncbi:MAG: 1-acyl-sn-glycerol-3-phosphate acyltransferase [Nanoarchaeota archaeon]|nr:1-acyl-sn-glycerol-3-phosphate acyltransferase [Nanoarchaeota archaeon]
MVVEYAQKFFSDELLINELELNGVEGSAGTGKKYNILKALFAGYFLRKARKQGIEAEYDYLHDFFQSVGIKKLVPFLTKKYNVFSNDLENLEFYVKNHYPGLILPNHKKFIDPFLLGSLIPEQLFVRGVSKKENLEMKLVGKILESCGGIGLDMNAEGKRIATPEVDNAITYTLSRGDLVLIFPEGTRNKNYDETKTFGTFKKGASKYCLMNSVLLKHEFPAGIPYTIIFIDGRIEKGEEIEVLIEKPVFLNKKIIEQYERAKLDERISIAERITDGQREQMIALSNRERIPHFDYERNQY